MKAVWYEANGAAKDVLAHGEMPHATPSNGEVLVRLHASGVNPSDVKARAGLRPMGFCRVIPHSDGAGMVEAVGSGVDPSLIGTRVFVRNGQWQRAFGTAAEYVTLPEGLVHVLPDATSYAVGAALGIPAMTAAHAVLKDGPVDGQTVLVHGGGGTVARLVVQIATDSGARVIATTGDSDKADWIREAGAVAVLDYRDPDLASAVAAVAGSCEVSRIIDGECGRNLATSCDIICIKGTIVGYGSALAPAPELAFLKMMFKEVTLTSVLVYLLEEAASNAYAAIIADMLERGVLDVAVAAALPLTKAAQAHRLVETGNRRGAVILTID